MLISILRLELNLNQRQRMPWGENYAASNSDVVQAAYATPQRVGNNYWDHAKTLGQMQQSLFSFILVIKKYSKRGLLYFFIVQSENFILSFY